MKQTLVLITLYSLLFTFPAFAAGAIFEHAAWMERIQIALRLRNKKRWRKVGI